MVNVTVSLDADTLRRARIHALEQGTSVNALVRAYLGGLVSADRSQDVGRRLVARAQRLAADSGASGRTWSRDDLYDR